MSQFYDQASLVMVPSGYKDGKLYSQKPLSTSGELAFSRGSDIEATRVNANGYIEKAQVNLLLQSNSFDTTWLNILTTSTSGQTGYDGSSNAWLLSKSAPAAYIEEGGLSGSGIYTLSVYAKAGTLNWLRFVIAHSGSNPACYYDLANGVVGTPKDNVDATITSVGGGWYRCSLTGDLSSLAAVRIYPADADEDTTGTSGNIYIQDAQLNYGLVAQTYQETTTAAVVSGITNDMPRLNYDPANPTCPSLLLEPSRQNLFANSEYFGASYWAKNNATITDNATTSPEGVVNAAALTENSSTSTHFMQHAQVLASASTYYSASFFVKYNGRHFQIVGSTGSEGGGYVNFDLVNGVVGNSDQLTGTIENYGGGWYRCTGTNISTSSATEIRLLPYLITSPTSARAESYAGNGTSGVYLYGAQMEQASYQSSMVPTYGSSATRTADSASKTGIASLIGQSEGTLFVEFESGADDATNHILSLSDGTTSNRVSLVKNTSDDLRAFVASGGASQASILWPNYAPNTNIKAAISYKANEIKFYANGENAGTDTSALVPTSLTQVEFETSGSPFAYPIKQLIVFPTALSATELATLTA